MLQELGTEEFSDNNFISTVRSEADMLELLKLTTDTLRFFSVGFFVDIDLYEILKVNPIPGITLLKRAPRESKPELFKRLQPIFDCSDIQFEKPVSFIDCHFGITVKFQNSIFLQGFDLRSSIFNQDLTMIDVDDKGPSSFGFKTQQSVVILRSKFDMSNNVYGKLEVEGDFHVRDTVFTSGLDISRCKINGQLTFEKVKFNGPLKVMNASIRGFGIGAFRDSQNPSELEELDISETNFLGQVQLENLRVNGTFRGQGAKFLASSFFTNIIFNADVYLNHTTFEKSLFIEKTTAKKNFSFYAAVINSTLRFEGLDFTQCNISFTGAYINADLWIGSLLHHPEKTYQGILNFQGAIISAASIVRIYNLNNAKLPSGEILFCDALIKGLLDIRNVYVNKITFEGTVVPGNIQENNTLNNAIKDRNSARLLKHEAKRINNMISAISYNKLEMSLYAKKISIIEFSDWSILKLNRMSNNYGANWFQGVLFTLVSSLLFYTAFNVCVHGFAFILDEHCKFPSDSGTFWSKYINYFWLPTGFADLISKNGVIGGFWGAFFFILGKIAIAFGIYQTIAAFRKYL